MFIADDVISGVVSGIRKQDLKASIERKIRNTVLIWAGLFSGNGWDILRRFTWEIIQTVLGLLSSHAVNLFLDVNRVVVLRNVAIIEGGGIQGSLSLGTFILLYKNELAQENNWVFMHEFGHVIQSRISGPLYLFKYGIPSLLTSNTAWMEKDANLRAYRYYMEKGLNLPVIRKKLPDEELAEKEIDPKWWEYGLLLLGIGMILVPILNLRKGR